MGAEPADVSSDVGGAVVTPAGAAALGAIQGPAELLPMKGCGCVVEFEPALGRAMSVGVAASFVSTLASEKLIALVERDRTLWPYAAYRAALAGAVLLGLRHGKRRCTLASFEPRRGLRRRGLTFGARPLGWPGEL